MNSCGEGTWFLYLHNWGMLIYWFWITSRMWMPSHEIFLIVSRSLRGLRLAGWLHDNQVQWVQCVGFSILFLEILHQLFPVWLLMLYKILHILSLNLRMTWLFNSLAESEEQYLPWVWRGSSSWMSLLRLGFPPHQLSNYHVFISSEYWR